MVVATRNCLFIHFPKNAGRWISETIIKNVKGSYYIGDATYNAHELPPEVNDKKVFICVREPATWLHSLWHHRARKKGLFGMRRFNWQNKFFLEKKCKSRNFDKFLEKAINLDNPLFDYYSQFIPNVDEIYLIYFENLADSLISFLEFCGEDFDKNGIIESSSFPVNTTKRRNEFNKQNNFKLDNESLSFLIQNNKKFFEFTDYRYKGSLLEIPKTFKKITREELNSYYYKNKTNQYNGFIGKKYINSSKTFLQNEIFALSSNTYKKSIEPISNFFRKIIFKTFCLVLKKYINLRYKPVQIEKEQDASSLCVEFVRGNSPLKRDKGFLPINLSDFDNENIDFKVNGNFKQLKPNSIKLIFSSHFLEYLTEEELSKYLESCQILLMKDGILECIIQSMEYNILQFICSEPESIIFKNAFAGFHGRQLRQDIGYWDVKKSTFTYSSIEQILLKHGFTVQFKKTSIKNIHFLATPNRKLFY